MNNKQAIINQALDIFKKVAPIRTGRFSQSIKAEPTADGFILYVDDTEVSYAKHLLTTSRRNPNAGWDEEAAELFALILAQLLKAGRRDGMEEL